MDCGVGKCEWKVENICGETPAMAKHLQWYYTTYAGGLSHIESKTCNRDGTLTPHFWDVSFK